MVDGAVDVVDVTVGVVDGTVGVVEGGCLYVCEQGMSHIYERRTIFTNSRCRCSPVKSHTSCVRHTHLHVISRSHACISKSHAFAPHVTVEFGFL